MKISAQGRGTYTKAHKNPILEQAKLSRRCAQSAT